MAEAGPPNHNLFKRQISESVQRMLNSSADLRMLNSGGADLFLLPAAENGGLGGRGGGGEPRDLARQESRDSLIEVALDNTEQIVSKLLGKNSRSILNGGSSSGRNQSPLLEL